MASEFMTSLKTVLQQLQDKEKSTSDLVKNLNTWAREVGDLIKNKVEEEVETSVKKMGFVKAERFTALEARVKKLESARTSKSSVKRSSSTRRVVKKSAPKRKVKR